jgi:hypothetical protein
MIIKSKSYKHNKAFKTVVDYVLREAEQDDSFVLTKFIKGKDLTNEEISKQFLENEQYRVNPRKNNVKLYMEILSFKKENAKDLDNTKLKKIAQQYLKLRSPLSVALVTAHKKEKDHIHLHILLSGCEYKTGKSARISRDDFKNKVKVPMEKYQEKYFPELHLSAINHQRTLSAKKKF